jgi:uncharacterized protein YggE
MAAPALAQTTAVAPQPYAPGPWWLRDPVVAVTGQVRTELRANRAQFTAAFQAVDKTAPDATKAAADKVRALGQALRGFPADKVRVATTFTMRPIYEQYRDKDGNLIDNRRADKIDRYEVTANLQVELRDAALAEQVYGAVIAARPTSAGQVFFRLEPDNATRTELYGLAVSDAARRAKLSVEGVGARLGAVKLIDPTGRACQTDVLVAGAPRSGGGDSTGLQEVVVTGSRIGAAPPAPPPPLGLPGVGGSAVTPEGLPLQVPLEQMTASACVVYALAG